jgi:MarR family transcriptional regulator, transcriptional regulator for hemolysin
MDRLVPLFDLGRHVWRHWDRRARAASMTFAQWVILLHIERRPHLSQSELATISEIDPLTVSRHIDRLEARGLVRRRRDRKDRRIWRLQLGPAARPMLHEIHRYSASFAERLFADLGQPMVEQTIGCLVKMTSNLHGWSGDDSEARPSIGVREECDSERQPCVATESCR